MGGNELQLYTIRLTFNQALVLWSQIKGESQIFLILVRHYRRHTVDKKWRKKWQTFPENLDFTNI